MTISRETTERVNKTSKVSPLEMSAEDKTGWMLGEIAILLAGLLDAKLAELGVTPDED